MAKQAKPIKEVTPQPQSPVISKDSFRFMVDYVNNASPVGFESSGQKLWLSYLKPFIDSSFTDPYGTAVGCDKPRSSV